MADYYAILGVAKTASESEIKAAFRKFAKIYHPDKSPNNPNAKGIFEQVLKAYNVLINPHSRKRYDTANDRDSFNKKPQQSKHKSQKNYSFTEEDLKQRAYYKNYYQSAKKKISTSYPHKPYSDYKYILFATPLAVGLLMLIISMFTNEPLPTQSKKTAIVNLDSIRKLEGVK